MNTRAIGFVDSTARECEVSISSAFGPPAIWLGLCGSPRMHLRQEQVRDLLPVLQRFADTGELP